MCAHFHISGSFGMRTTGSVEGRPGGGPYERHRWVCSLLQIWSCAGPRFAQRCISGVTTCLGRVRRRSTLQIRGYAPFDVADMELSAPGAANMELPASAGALYSIFAAFAALNSIYAALGTEALSVTPDMQHSPSITPNLQHRVPGHCRCLQICSAR